MLVDKSIITRPHKIKEPSKYLKYMFKSDRKHLIYVEICSETRNSIDKYEESHNGSFIYQVATTGPDRTLPEPPMSYLLNIRRIRYYRDAQNSFYLVRAEVSGRCAGARSLINNTD